MTIRRKLTAALLTFAVMPILLVGTWGFMNARKTLESVQVEGLRSIADLKARRIEDFFAMLEKDIVAVSDNANIKRAIAVLADSLRDLSNPVYKEIRNELDSILKVKQKVYQYLNVVLLNPEGGVVYVLHQSTALEGPGDLQDLWSMAFDRGRSGVHFSEVFSSDTKGSQFFMLLTAPVDDFEGKFAGVIGFLVDMEPIYKIVQETSGLGETGETLIAKKVGDAALFLNPLRHDPSAALQRKLFFGEKQAIPIQEALNGRDGSGLSIDYRGKKVIAAWRNIPSRNWAMVAKIDVSEALAPITTLRNFFMMLMTAAVFVSILVALWVSKSIADPIRSLQKGAEAIGSGNLDYKIRTDAAGEVGQLARAFDHMTENLKSITASRDELESEVTRRKKAEEAMYESMRRLRERVKELDCLFTISSLVEKPNISLQEILAGTVDLIPPAWEYPEITCARIRLHGQEFKTKNFQETKWMQARDIIAHGMAIGTLEVAYLEERPQRDEGPFLTEERKVIDAIARRLGTIIKHKRAEEGLLRSEARFRDLVENALTGIFIIQDNQIVYGNPEQERLSGSLSQPTGLLDFANVHPDDVEKVKQGYQKIVSGDAPTLDMDFRLYAPDKPAGKPELKWVHCRASSIEYRGRKAILVNIMDVTNVKQMENLLRVQDKMSSLGRVTAGIAHEIRNPLSGINVYLSTLGKIFDSAGDLEKAKEILGQMQSASNKMESVIKRVMDFSKPGDPKFLLANINQPVEEAIELSSVALRKDGIKIEKVLGADLALCRMDPNLIEEVILNLITNAAEAMRKMEGTKIIQVATQADSNRVVVRVSDSGPGIPLYVGEKLFDPFYTTKDGSTGIGLAICRRIVGDHGGSLHVSDSRWGGAEFVVEIPLDKGTGE